MLIFFNCLISLIVVGCCDVECNCEEVEVVVQSSTFDISVTRTDQNFNPLGTVKIAFSFFANQTLNYEGVLDKTSFDLVSSSTQPLPFESYIYIFKNLNTGSSDTLSSIAYNLASPVEVKCADCLIQDATTICEKIIDKKLVFNGAEIKEFEITLR